MEYGKISLRIVDFKSMMENIGHKTMGCGLHTVFTLFDEDFAWKSPVWTYPKLCYGRILLPVIWHPEVCLLWHPFLIKYLWRAHRARVSNTTWWVVWLPSDRINKQLCRAHHMHAIVRPHKSPALWRHMLGPGLLTQAVTYISLQHPLSEVYMAKD